MSINDLEKLNAAVELLTHQDGFQKTLEQLSEQINHSREPFVWSVIDLNSIDRELPEGIKSCWMFVLRKGVWSGCHYHPNSIQHMVTIKGQGISKVAGIKRRMVQYGSSADSLTDVWYVIDKGVPHEFFPEGGDMVVVSFHTCEASDLEEIACETGERRVYQAGI